MKRNELKYEILRVASMYVLEEKEKGRKVRYQGVLYYLSGWFKHDKVYLTDLLSVLENFEFDE